MSKLKLSESEEILADYLSATSDHVELLYLSFPELKDNKWLETATEDLIDRMFSLGRMYQHMLVTGEPLSTDDAQTIDSDAAKSLIGTAPFKSNAGTRFRDELGRFCKRSDYVADFVEVDGVGTLIPLDNPSKSH